MKNWSKKEKVWKFIIKLFNLDLSTAKNTRLENFHQEMIQLDSCGYKNAESESNTASNEG